MNAIEYKQVFLEEVKSNGQISGDGSCAAFVEKMANHLEETQNLPGFNAAYHSGTRSKKTRRIDGYFYDEYDNAMLLFIADYQGDDFNRAITTLNAKKIFSHLQNFVCDVFENNLQQEIEESTPCADLIEELLNKRPEIRKYRFLLFTDADSSKAKIPQTDTCCDIPIEYEIWDICRLYNLLCSNTGRQLIEINFTDYLPDGIPCIEASSANNKKYKSYLGVIPGRTLADIYDKYGSRILEGNVRSFLSTKVAVNKKIRATILNDPQMFFAYNNGISATAMEVDIKDVGNSKRMVYAKDFQIINGGQTTASIFNARLKDKASLDNIYVQMKLTVIDSSNASQEESDNLIQNISRSSNSQNKVSEADFFATHPFHRRMEQLVSMLPECSDKTRWFYERARGQYMQQQMKMTPSQRKQFALINPKKKVITKTDLAKVQNVWRELPHIASKGSQTNFANFAEYIEKEWQQNETKFNDRYFKETAALMLMFHYLETSIPRQSWYQNGYRANIIYYAISLLHYLIKKQFSGRDLDLVKIWNRQAIPADMEKTLIELSRQVLENITTNNKVANVTQWCKRKDCWDNVKAIEYDLPNTFSRMLITAQERKSEEQSAKKEQKTVNGINAQTEVLNHSSFFWRDLFDFLNSKKIPFDSNEEKALYMACQIPNKLPNSFQCGLLLDILNRAKEEGFNADRE